MKKQLRSAFTTRQYMLSEDYEIFYYSDTDFRSVGRHSHGYYEFYFFAEGSVEMRGDQRTVSLSPGDVLTVAPGTEHQAVVTDGSKPYRRFVLWMSKKYCRSLPESCRYLLDAADGEGILPQHFGPVEFNLVCGKLLNLQAPAWHTQSECREDWQYIWHRMFRTVSLWNHKLAMNVCLRTVDRTPHSDCTPMPIQHTFAH